MGPGETDTRNVDTESMDANVNVLFKMLANDRRRALLTNLRDTYKADPTDLVPDGDTPEAVAQLHHVHLPKLEDCGYITWNRDANTVTRGPEFGFVESMLDSIPLAE